MTESEQKEAAILRKLAEVYVGNEYHWEPTKRHASTWCRVVDVVWSGGELWVVSVSILDDGQVIGGKRVNELSRFVEATTINYVAD